MKIKIEKPKESIWKFPCFGIHEKTSKIVAFMDDKKGVIVEKGYGVLPLGTYFEDWEMIQFKPYTPTETKPKPIDWDNVELPIWVEDKDGIITQIAHIYETEIREFIIPTDGKISYNSRLFITPQQKIEYLNSLKLAPKGTKIIIEL